MARVTRASDIKYLGHKMSGISEPSGLRARLVGIIAGTVPFGSTNYAMDWQITNVSWLGVNKQTYFDGVEYEAFNCAPKDYVNFSVVDKDGITYPAGTVLEEFGNTYYVTTGKNMIKLYRAKLLVGMYIRVLYTSVGSANNVDFVCNLLRHLDENKDS